MLRQMTSAIQACLVVSLLMGGVTAALAASEASADGEAAAPEASTSATASPSATYASTVSEVVSTDAAAPVSDVRIRVKNPVAAADAGTAPTILGAPSPDLASPVPAATWENCDGPWTYAGCCSANRTKMHCSDYYCCLDDDGDGTVDRCGILCEVDMCTPFCAL